MSRDRGDDKHSLDKPNFEVAGVEDYAPFFAGEKTEEYGNGCERGKESLADVLWSIQEGWERGFNALTPGSIVIQCAPLVGEMKKIERTCQKCMGKSVEDFILQDLLSACTSKPNSPFRVIVEGNDFHTCSLGFHIKDTPQSWENFGDKQCEGSGVSYSFAFKKDRLCHCYVGYHEPSPQLDTLYREVLPTIVEFCEQREQSSFWASKEALYHGGVIEKDVWSGDTPMGWHLRRHARQQWDATEKKLPKDVVRRIEPVYRFEDPRDIRLILDESHRMLGGVLLRDHLLKTFLENSGLIEVNFKDPEARRRMDVWLSSGKRA